MRVLHVIAGAPAGGAETICLDNIEALSERGIEQKVVCRPHPVVVARLDRLSVPYVPQSFSHAARLLGGPATIRREAAGWRADVVHAWMSRAASFVPPGMPCPAVGWLGGYYDPKYFRTADRLIAITPRIRDHLLAHGIAPQRAVLCHTFGTLPEAPPVTRGELGVPGDALLLLMLSRLHWKKGIDTALQALARLPGAHLLLAGDGPERARYETLAGELKVAERAHFLGWRTDRKALLALCDICLLPSRYEPFGTVITEAWAMRRPLVASLADGARQFVRDDETGALFAIDDAEMLAARIAQIASDREFARRLVENGYRAYCEGFSREAVTARLIEIYQAAIAARQPAAAAAG